MPSSFSKPNAPSTLGGLVRLAQVVAAGTPATITFASISQSYTNLLLIFCGRDTANGGATDVHIMFNGDATSGNYTTAVALQSDGSSIAAGTVAASAAGGSITIMVGVSGNANAVGVGQILIPSYANPAFYKSALGFGFTNGASRLLKDDGFVWSSNAPITSITITAGATAFVNGSTATLYGLL